jgi:5-methylcytosine-specific restriction endonuclease McrA
MNWIRPAKRLAIYLRDGMACVWCGAGVEDEVKLTLDHLKPYSKGGSNDATNLVTCCHRCNSSRGSRGVMPFARAVASYLNHGADPNAIHAHVQKTRMRVLDVVAANELIARRGGFVAAVQSAK